MKRFGFLLLCCVLFLANAQTGSCDTVYEYFRAKDGSIFQLYTDADADYYRIEAFYVYWDKRAKDYDIDSVFCNSNVPIEFFEYKGVVYDVSEFESIGSGLNFSDFPGYPDFEEVSKTDIEPGSIQILSSLPTRTPEATQTPEPTPTPAPTQTPEPTVTPVVSEFPDAGDTVSLSKKQFSILEEKLDLILTALYQLDQMGVFLLSCCLAGIVLYVMYYMLIRFTWF